MAPTIKCFTVTLTTGSICSVGKADEPVLGPAFIVRFWTNRVQLTPSHRYCNSMLWNALAYHGLFDPIRSSLREREIVDQVAS